MGSKAAKQWTETATTWCLSRSSGTLYTDNSKTSFWVALLLVTKHGFTLHTRKWAVINAVETRLITESQKFKVLPSAGEVMTCVFSDSQGVILNDFVPSGSTVNAGDDTVHYGQTGCGQLSVKSDQICCGKTSYCNMIMLRHIRLVRPCKKLLRWVGHCFHILHTAQT